MKTGEEESKDNKKNLSGSAVVNDVESSEKPASYREPEPWEKNLVSLNKGEWGDDMDESAFHRYQKSRTHVGEIFDLSEEEEQKEEPEEQKQEQNEEQSEQQNEEQKEQKGEEKEDKTEEIPEEKEEKQEEKEEKEDKQEGKEEKEDKQEEIQEETDDKGKENEKISGRDRVQKARASGAKGFSFYVDEKEKEHMDNYFNEQQKRKLERNNNNNKEEGGVGMVGAVVVGVSLFVFTYMLN